MTVTTIADKIQKFFQEDSQDVVCVYLFGSEARGTARDDSDVDIAVLYTKTPPSTLEGLGLDLEGDLEQYLSRPVDLVILNRAPVDLVHRVLRDGLLVFERDASARIRFEVKARNEYFDLLPFLHRHRRYRSQADS